MVCLVFYHVVCPAKYIYHASYNNCFIVSGWTNITLHPVHCSISLTVNLFILTFTLKIISGLLLWHCKWQLLHIFKAHQSNMWPLHFGVILTLKLWHSPGKSYLSDCSETIDGNCFIDLWQMDIMWYLCTVGMVWYFNLETITFSFNYFSGVLLRNYKWNGNSFILYGNINLTCGLCTTGHVDRLTHDHDIITFTFKILSNPLVGLETILGKYFIFSGHTNLSWEMYTVACLTLKLWHLTLKSCLQTLVQPRWGVFNVNVIFKFANILPYMLG